MPSLFFSPALQQIISSSLLPLVLAVGIFFVLQLIFRALMGRAPRHITRTLTPVGFSREDYDDDDNNGTGVRKRSVVRFILPGDQLPFHNEGAEGTLLEEQPEEQQEQEEESDSGRESLPTQEEEEEEHDHSPSLSDGVVWQGRVQSNARELSNFLLWTKRSRPIAMKSPWQLKREILAEERSRNLLNKKDVPPSTIKESSESSQTLDEQEAGAIAAASAVDKESPGLFLKHENTVIRVDTVGGKTPLAAASPTTPHHPQSGLLYGGGGVVSLGGVAINCLSATGSAVCSPTSPAGSGSAGSPLPQQHQQQSPRGGVGGATGAAALAAFSAQKQEIVRVTQQLLDAISCKDFEAYSRLCDSSMTCFEPETLGNLIEGMDFHKFYFDHATLMPLAVGNSTSPSRGGVALPPKVAHQIHTTLLNPNVHLMGEEGACIAYVRLTQYVDKFGDARTRQAQETRVWQKRNGRGWICVHVHRSGDPSSTSTAAYGGGGAGGDYDGHQQGGGYNR